MNLFINSLVNEETGKELEFMRPKDVEDEIREKHALFFKEEIEGQKFDSTNKINKICDALKVELLKRNETSFYLLPILTVYVKK